MSTDHRPGFEVLEPFAGESDINALAVTDTEGIFVVYMSTATFLYFDAASQHCNAKSRWTRAGTFSCSIQGQFGLFFRSLSGHEGSEARCAFVEDPRSFVCIRLGATAPQPDVGTKDRAVANEVTLVTRTPLPDDVVAVAGSAPGDADEALVALAFLGGSIRCYDPTRGKAVGKTLKLEPISAAEWKSKSISLARLGAHKYVLVCGTNAPPIEVDFYIIAFNAEVTKCELQRSGTLRGTNLVAPSPGPWSLLGAAVLNVAGGIRGHGKRLLMCWGPDGRNQNSFFVSATGLESEAPVLTACSRGGVHEAADAGFLGWLPVQGYIAELSRSFNEGMETSQVQVILRDGRFGMRVASRHCPLSSQRDTRILSATCGGVSMIAQGKAIAVLRWKLPAFALHMVVGSAASKSQVVSIGEAGETLQPLRELVVGKRKRDDPSIVELFSAKRKMTEKVLAQELRGRRWRPSVGLLDTIIHYKSWTAARALLALPELDEDSAVRLLAARPELLPRVVKRSRNPQVLGAALRDFLPASQLQVVIEMLLVWLESYKNFPEDEVHKAAPDLPKPAEIIEFFSALADGCLPSLARLDVELIEKVLDGLHSLQAEYIRTERLYGAVRAAVRPARPIVAPSAEEAVEAFLLPL